MPDDKVTVTLRALLIQRNVRHALTLVQTAGGFAIGISGASHELPKASAFEHHHAAAILAVLFRRAGVLNVSRVEVRQIDGIFLGKVAAAGIFFIVRTASVEGAVLSPLDDERRTAALALFISGLLNTLDVFHVLRSVFEVLLELFVEIGERLRPGFLAFLNLVQLFFELGGVLNIEDVAEVLDQKIGNDQADFRRREFSAQLLHILPLLDGAQNRRVGGWTSNAPLFQLLYQ